MLTSPAVPDATPSRFVRWISYYVQLFGLRGKGAILIVALIVIAWVNSGIYMVQPDEQGVVLRFGKWVDTTNPGLHYHYPFPIETVLFPKVTQVNQLQLGSGPGASSNAQDEALGRQRTP